MRKRERTREQAAELRQMQKLFLLKAMANPGQPVVHMALIMTFIIIMALIGVNIITAENRSGGVLPLSVVP